MLASTLSGSSSSICEAVSTCTRLMDAMEEWRRAPRSPPTLVIRIALSRDGCDENTTGRQVSARTREELARLSHAREGLPRLLLCVAPGLGGNDRVAGQRNGRKQRQRGKPQRS